MAKTYIYISKRNSENGQLRVMPIKIDFISIDILSMRKLPIVQGLVKLILSLHG